MPVITITTLINAPVERCFDISRDIDIHMTSTAHTGERAVAGRTGGLIGLGESVTWRARHFGIWQNLTSKITEFNYPEYFVDEMIEGAFKSFRHEHRFEANGTATIMRDVFDYQSPFGLVGKLVDALFLKRYMTRLLIIRNEVIKAEAEKINN